MGQVGGVTMHERIENDFTYHAPDDDKVRTHDRVRVMFKQMAHLIVDEVPSGREQAIVLTKLEEAMMWANAGIAREG